MPAKPDRRRHYLLVLRERLDEVARMVLPDGRRRGAEFEGPGVDGLKWNINIGNGTRRGAFSIFSIGYHGDVVDFVCRGLFNDDWASFDEWAVGWTGWNDMQARPELLRSAEEQARQAELAKQERAATEAVLRIKQAHKIYRHADADPAPVFAYLVGRGLPASAGLVPALRFSASVRYELGGQRDKFLPAMIAPVVGASGDRFAAVHRTYLEEDNGTWRKARLGKPRLSLGPVAGGIIPLIGGAWADWLTAQGAPAEALLLAEGIENALSAAIAFPGTRCCACISAGNLGAVSELLPRHADPVILVVDRDDGSRGRKDILAQREAALDRWLAQGRHVMVVAAPRGVKDLNDYLRWLIHKHSYKPRLGETPVLIDWRAALAQARPVTAGDPVALWWETLTGASWDGTQTLLLHPELPLIEAADAAAPAMLVPVHGQHREPVGILVAWLTQRHDSWSLASLLLPVRILGSDDGVVIIRRARRESGEARLVIGLESALVVAAWEAVTVICACDLSHAVRCACGVPAGIEALDVYGENEDETVAWQLLSRHMRRALAGCGIERVRWKRPWRDYPTFRAMYRDAELGLTR